MIQRIAILSLLVAFACCQIAEASQVVLEDLAGLTAGSSDVVIGRVESIRSYWNPAHTRIYTETVLRVDQTLKGRGDPTLTLVQMGGEVDGARISVEGMPAFRPRQEALVFVWRDAGGRAQVNGLAQGKFDIATDPTTGERTISRNLDGLVPAASKHSTTTQRVVQLPRRLSDLESEIRRLVANPPREGEP